MKRAVREMIDTWIDHGCTFEEIMHYAPQSVPRDALEAYLRQNMKRREAHHEIR